MSVLLNTTAGSPPTLSFAAQQTFTTGTGPDSVTAADVDGDGKPDLAVANNDDSTVSVLLDTPRWRGHVQLRRQQTFADGEARAA